MMCSSATALHALKKARLQAGESVAVFGVGGLGLSAIQLAKALGAAAVYAIDISEDNLAAAERFGAVPLNANKLDTLKELERLTDGEGVNVSLELAGLPQTMQQAVQALGIRGRAAMVGISDQSFPVTPYHQVINKEAEIIGVSDHLSQELPLLLQFAQRGLLNLEPIVRRRVPLEARAVNETLDNLQNFREKGRVVIVPGLDGALSE
jgi:propanol-preferring alcohol dehydrogenase